MIGLLCVARVVCIWFERFGPLGYASVSGRVDHGSVCRRNYARTKTSLACIHGVKE